MQAQFNVQLAASGYDLDKWRRSKLNFAETELEILDANGESAPDGLAARGGLS